MCFLFAGISLALLGLSASATSLLAMLVAGALSLYLFIASRFKLGFIRMVVVAILFTAVIALTIANIDTAELVGRTDDLTGRGEVWKQTWDLILDNPLTGVGYGSLWYPTDDTIWIQQSLTDFTWVVYHAHNGLLQVASEVGLPLATIALLMVVQQLIEIFYCQYERQQVGVLFVLAFVTAYLISNFSEARFLVNRELFWIFFLALPVSMLRQVNLVSADINVDAEDPELGMSAPAEHVSVPGKPWLNPRPSELPTRNHKSTKTAAGTAAASVVPYVATANASGEEISKWVDSASDEQADISVIQDDIIDLRATINDEDLRFTETMDLDRYEMDFEATEEWVDVPLAEEE